MRPRRKTITAPFAPLPAGLDEFERWELEQFGTPSTPLDDVWIMRREAHRLAVAGWLADRGWNVVSYLAEKRRRRRAAVGIVDEMVWDR